MNLGPDDYLRKNLSFPELREITDYLLVFKAGRVLSFSTLFPNLAVIRGNKLLGNWALIIFQNENLAEIGLLSPNLNSPWRCQDHRESKPLLCQYRRLEEDC
ncbi:hypothetical protein TCAL_16954 [Tigriopus californicus]|uniref:Receptor L-domain domain-containing protein n=2 Tax=Tigriopus californicus TaxID=6832 RepID=A0A553NP95_TIGCA|nr:hypothetical protein TCAL_16954 [Tigriopus californicus]